MDRRFRGSLASALLVSAFGLFAVEAHAGPKDAAATKLDKQAMDDDYLNVRFDKAEEKLNKALKECGDKGCEPKLKAQIYMHLGIILVNAGKKDEGTKAFAEGLKVDSGAAPEKDFTSPDVQKAYEAAKGAGKKEPDPPPKGGGDDDGGKSPASDLKHEPITESPVNTPIPIYVAAESGAAKFVLNYKPFGGGEWTKIEMKRMGKGFGAEIPCKDTNTTGTLKYYIVAQDAGGDPTGSAGSKKQPYDVAIKQKVSGDAPAFPGKDPPAQCKGKDACPPGINEPGCEATALGYGSKCTGPGQCNKADGLACIDGTCSPGAEEGDGGSSDDGSGAGPAKKNWLSISASLDDAIVGGGQVCTVDNYENGTYACYRDDGKIYKPGNLGKDRGTVSGPPFAVGTFRFLVGFDRLIASTFLLGLRAGYALNGGPAVPSSSGEKKFFPFHAELRATYFIGKDSLTKTGVRPFVFVSGGAAQVDAKVAGVPVSNDCDANTADQPRTCVTSAQNNPTDNPNGLPVKKPAGITVDAWRKMGTSFVAIGGGMVYAVNKRSGISLDIKLANFFGSPGIAVSPTVGYVYGL